MAASSSSSDISNNSNNSNKRKSFDLDKSNKQWKQSSSSTVGVIGKGEWVTHLSLPIEFDKWQTELIESLRDELKRNFPDIVSDVIMCDEFHMSVSRTLRVKKAQINEIISCIEAKLKSKSKFKCFFTDVVVLRCGQFGGEERRKLFLAFKVSPSMEAQGEENSLSELMDDLNSCLKSLNLPEYFKNPTFHISFSYIKLAQDYEEEMIKKLMDNFRNEIRKFLAERNLKHEPIDQCALKIERVKLKSGNSLHFFKLN